MRKSGETGSAQEIGQLRKRNWAGDGAAFSLWLKKAAPMARQAPGGGHSLELDVQFQLDHWVRVLAGQQAVLF
jgi:hypothetical protein